MALQGLPLLTCPGDTFISRMGVSLCAATGLEELICPTPEAYRHQCEAHIARDCATAEGLGFNHVYSYSFD